ncbi:MAG: alpha/beta hydrolase [Alphaproteobacteria bacterium]|nr:MAG: alpha/beta hydrolase [Alphaproteobacteria bacterium]
MFRKLKQIFNSTTELQRAAWEYTALQMSWASLKDKLPEGDGHPVLIFPGFLTGDSFTAPLRKCVEEKGYKTYGWDNGVNFGLDEASAEHLKKRLKEVFDENGGKKVTLVGHSLGGIYARELAREFPEMVRGVVTMGTPFGMMDDPAAATSRRLSRLYDFFNPGSDKLKFEDIRERMLTPPPVPTTSLYSKEDGIVDWKGALNPSGPQSENIEVHGSHLGMACNPMTIAAVIDRLAQAEGDWKPFDPAAYRSFFYPANDTEGPLPENPKWQKDPKKKSMFGDKPKP